MNTVQQIKLRESLTVQDAVRCFRDCAHLLVLDSSAGRADFDARYSFLSAEPVAVHVVKEAAYGDDLFSAVRELQKCLPDLQKEASPVPPFCGGLAGLMSYEIGQVFERLPSPLRTDFPMPVLWVGLFDWSIVWDHQLGTVELFVLQLSGDDPERSNAAQRSRLDWVQTRLNAPDKSKDEASQESRQVHWDSVFQPSQYVAAVQQVIDYISAGDIFQANLAQQLTADWKGTAEELFERVRQYNAAPFSALLKVPDFAIVSASPERFVKVDGKGQVETRPIKGTRRRQKSPVADLMIGEELKASAKDRAENVMIVDLLRNDISRVCEVGSVRVSGVCELEVFETVQHLVSTIIGTLQPDKDVWDLCAATLPGGSITGAPKIRAMEIIAELEPVVRGAYCGNLFYCGPGGDFDSSILIRTFTLQNHRVQFPVGGGIVADSDPIREYEETLHKASGMLSVLNGRSRPTE